MKRIAVALSISLFLLLPTSVTAAECEFVLGFKTLRDLIGHEIVGECLENQHHGANGDALQRTSGGLLAWRKADNWTAFTDGHRTWINGPNGLVQRLNTERFSWEADYAPGGDIATPVPPSPEAPTASPGPVQTPSPDSIADAERTLAALPWVQDGLANRLEQATHDELRALAAASPPVFRAWIDEFGDNPLRGLTPSRLRVVTIVARSDEWAALQMLQTPFMLDRVTIYDFAFLRFMTNLESVRAGSLRQVLSRPEFQGGLTAGNFPQFALLAFQHVDPEVASAMGALSWTQDGVAGPSRLDSLNVGSAARGDFELPTLLNLMDLLFRSRQAFLTLVRLPWIQDEISPLEKSITSDIHTVAFYDAEIARQLAAMPFLQTVEVNDNYILDTITSHFRNDPEGVRWILSHPAMAGEISNDHLGEFALLRLDRENPARATVLRSLPWIKDGVAIAENPAVVRLGGLAEESSEQFFQAIIQKPWVQDGLSKLEVDVVRAIANIAYYGPREGYGDEEVALRVFAMPFLDTVERADFLAAGALDYLHDDNPGYLHDVLSHPTLRDGIGDEHTALIMVAAEAARVSGPEAMLAVLEPGRILVWKRTIVLPEFGSVELAVYSEHPEAEVNLDWLAHAVRSHVDFIGLPLAANFVPLFVHDRGGGGGGAGTTLSVGSLSSPETVAHELAHYYWVYSPRWLQEGPASFMESVSEHKRIGTPVKAFRDGHCSFTDTLLGLEEYLRKRVPSSDQCEYSLGSALFVDLYHSLGDQAFRDSFRKLYLLLAEHRNSETCFGREIGICYVKRAFVTDASPEAVAIALPIINRRYYGSEHGPQ